MSLTQAAEAVTMAAEEESRQRRSLAGEYAASLAHQLELLHQDLCARQEQWASFCSALMEAQWLLKASASSSPEKSPQPGQSPEEYVLDQPESECRIQIGERESMASQSPRSNHIKCPFPSLIVSALGPPFHILCLCRVASQLDTLLGHLSRAMLQEGHRLKAWGFLDTGTGAELLQAGKRCLASSRTYGKEVN